MVLPEQKLLARDAFGPLRAIGSLVTSWAWGCDLIIYWYSPPQLDDGGRPVLPLFPRELGPLSRRFVAPFVLLWFVVPPIGILFVLAR